MDRAKPLSERMNYMIQSRKPGRYTLLLLLAAFACAGSWAAVHLRSVQDTSEVVKMTEEMRLVCVGRSLIDVPAQSELSFSNQVLDGLEISTVEESEAVFRARLAAREKEIEALGMTTDSRGPGGMVEARDLRLVDMAARLLVYGRTRSYSMEGDHRVDDEWMSIEAHVHVNALSFTFSMQYADPSDVPAVEALLERFRPRGENEIPSVPGFCVWRGIFAEPLPSHKTEHIVMHLGLPGHPDMGIAYSSVSGVPADDGLLARIAVVDAETRVDDMLRVTKLRSGKRSINGVEGEEELERLRARNFLTGYSLLWEAQGLLDDPVQSKLSLAMIFGNSSSPGGEPIGSSFHEDAVLTLTLWDRISSSIRLRRVAARIDSKGARTDVTSERGLN